jgi:predicted nucleotidyltransferase
MFLNNYIKEIQKLCEINNVKVLYAFGSVLTEKFGVESDIDLIVDIQSDDPLVYAEHYFNLKFELENLLQRKIDLLESKAIKNPFLLENIEKSKTLIYAA